MQVVRNRRVVPVSPSLLASDYRAHEVSVRCYSEMTDGLLIPEPRAALWRKWRSVSQDMNPFGRYLSHLVEGMGYGMSEEAARLGPVAATHFIDSLYGERPPKLDAVLFTSCVEAENAENVAEAKLLTVGRTVANLREFARTKRREAMRDLMAATAADCEADARERAI